MLTGRLSRRALWSLLCCVAASLSGVVYANDSTAELVAGLKPLAAALTGRESLFEIKGSVTVPIDGSAQTIDIRIARFDADSFDLELTHADYAVVIRRRADLTAMALPKHLVAFVGRGTVAPGDS